MPIIIKMAPPKSIGTPYKYVASPFNIGVIKLSIRTLPINIDPITPAPEEIIMVTKAKINNAGLNLNIRAVNLPKIDMLFFMPSFFVTGPFFFLIEITSAHLGFINLFINR